MCEISTYTCQRSHYIPRSGLYHLLHIIHCTVCISLPAAICDLCVEVDVPL